MRNLVIAYICVLVMIMGLWYAIIPSEDEVMRKLAEEKMASTVRALQSEILSRYGTVSISGNLTYMIYTYRNVSIDDWELLPNMTTMILYFSIERKNRVKRFGTVIDEYDLEPEQLSMVARKEGDAWHLDTSTVRNITKAA